MTEDQKAELAHRADAVSIARTLGETLHLLGYAGAMDVAHHLRQTYDPVKVVLAEVALAYANMLAELPATDVPMKPRDLPDPFVTEKGPVR